MTEDDDKLFDVLRQGASEADEQEEENPFVLSDQHIEDILEALHSGYDDIVIQKSPTCPLLKPPTCWKKPARKTVSYC